MTEPSQPAGPEGAGPGDGPQPAGHQPFVERLLEGDSYGTLLVAILATYAVLAILQNHIWSRAAIGLCFGLTLLLALHTSHVRGRAIRIVAVLVLGSVLLSGAFALFGEPTHGISYFVVVLVVAAPLVVLVRVARHPVVNLETILGSIDAYLLIGMMFAVVYGMVDDIGTEHFFAQGAATSVQYIYFSFVVLTTLGFGDLTPGTDTGRILVTFEALLGQLFLVTIVAVLVANLGRTRLRFSARDPQHLGSGDEAAPGEPPEEQGPPRPADG